MVGLMMWFKRDPKPISADKENGVVGKLRRKKTLLKPTRESSERETSTESDKEKRRYSDILDMKVSLERRDESDESLYESADGHSDAISASDDALPRLGKTPTISKESLKLAVTDEEVEIRKKTHRKTMSLSNPLEIVRSLGDEWFDSAKKDLDRHSDKKKSRESLWSEEDRDSIHGSTMRLDQSRKNSKKEDKSQSNSRKSSTTDAPKTRKSSKSSSVSALNFLRRKKTPTSNVKPVEAVAEDVVDTVVQKSVITDEILNFTKLFLEGEKLHASISQPQPPVETDSDDEDEPPTPKQLSEHRRRLSRQTSRSKSKVRGKSQSLKVNTLRKSHSGTLKKGKKKSVKAPSAGRSRQASIVEQTPLVKKKHSESMKQNSWLFSGSRGESRREGSNDEPTAPDADVDTSDANSKEPDKDNNWRGAAPPGAGGSGRGVNRAESCRERDAPRRGKHRNASDPNRLTAHNNHDLEPGAATAPSGSSSSSSLSSRSNESNTVAAEQQASQSDWSEEDEPLAAQWADSLPAHVIDSLVLCPRLRKRQEVIHELIASEGSHVRWLKVLGGVFLRGLEGQPSLLPSDELRALFPNLPDVRERHARLYSDLRQVRNEAKDHVVQIRPIADAVLNTLGEGGYARCLSHFCSRQRMALEQLRERRRKHKELHQFLAAREQLPLCGRLQLRDLLACVWQRLTKYQLLLEGILKTISDGESEKEEDVSRLRRAHDVARDVLHAVDGAIRSAENEHRLRTIQSKLEVRVPTAAGEWEELRRLPADLPLRALRMEGDLAIRNDNNKKINVLALMLSECLVLLQREGEKFVLKPIAQNHPVPLSPLIKWDKVIFRPNAAVRNTFFLVHINGVQMHELSANTAQEYATWVRHIQEAPLAKLTELKPANHHHRPTLDTTPIGTNVSRNPSDASEKSSSTTNDEPESERDRTSLERSSAERERDETSREEPPAEPDTKEECKEETKEENKEADVEDAEEKHKPRRPTVGRISTHGAEPAPALEPSAALTVHAPAALNLAHTAHRAYTHQERLRQLDVVISRALAAKSGVVARVLGVPPHSFAQVAELALAEALGQVDIREELRSTADGTEDEANTTTDSDDAGTEPDIHQLLLAAHTQVNQLTEILRGALSVDEAGAVAARAAPARAGRCDACLCRPRGQLHRGNTYRSTDIDAPEHPEHEVSDNKMLESVCESSLEQVSFDMLDELEVELDQEHHQHHHHQHHTRGELHEEPDVILDGSCSGLSVARRAAVVCGGLGGTVSALAGALPPVLADRARLRDQLAALREHNDALRARLATREYQTTEDMSFQKEGLDPSIQDQPSNGG